MQANFWDRTPGSRMPTPDQLRAWDLAHVWHPFTQHDEWDSTAPLVIERAEGVELIDVDGRRYLDGVSSLWTNVHGHRVPEIDQALREQLDRVAHSTLLGLASTPSIELARSLVEITPGTLCRVFFSDSGSTAAEVGLKIAFQFQQQSGQTERTRFAGFAEAYHGDTLGSVSVGGIDLFHSIYRPLLFDAVRFPSPDHCDPSDEAACLSSIEALLEQHGHELAGFIFEPLVQGAAGMRMHSPDFLRRVLQSCREAGLVLVADEVATGFGRTGTRFAMEQVGVEPDILCLAKGMSGGYLPMAATLATERIFDAFRGPHGQDRTFFHGHTYTGNALGCAASLASIRLLDRALAGLPERIEALRQALGEVPEDLCAGTRQRGMMAAIELANPHDIERLGHRVCMRARHHGVIVRPLGDRVIVMPPLVMSPTDIARVVQAVVLAARDLAGQGR